jgi:hypothetical protein
LLALCGAGRGPWCGDGLGKGVDLGRARRPPSGFAACAPLLRGRRS